MEKGNNHVKWKRIEVFAEFLVFGIVVGVIEDIIAVKVVANAAITWHTVGVIILIAIPFAVLGEFVVDRIDFVSILHRKFGKKEHE
ncbi:MAG TPA: hypothetical protein VGA53_02825 [Candidatus Paceibacterota bacterium]